MNIGQSSRLPYDQCAYEDKLNESVAPLSYRMEPYRIDNCDACFSAFGPRGNYGVSTLTGHKTAPSQALVDLESVLTNRNVLQSKCKDGKVNDIDVSKFKLQHVRACDNYLDPVASRLTNPTANYRGVSINRFHDLDRDPQENIFWSFARNTTLEARDNYRVKVPKLADGDVNPKPVAGQPAPCRMNCQGDCPECKYPMAA
jgi:hypothetical protein